MNPKQVGSPITSIALVALALVAATAAALATREPGDPGAHRDAANAHAPHVGQSSAPKGAKLIITVLDAASGKPVEGANVRVQIYPDKQEGKTDAQGRYVVTLPGEMKRGINAHASMVGYVGQSAWSEPPGTGASVATTEWTLRLVKADAIHGKVTDPTGKPIADVKITLRVGEAPRRDGVPFLSDNIEAQTDAQGAFQLLGKPRTGLQSLDMFRLEMEHPAHLPGQWNTADRMGQTLFSPKHAVSMSDFLAGQAVFILDPDTRRPFTLAGGVRSAEGAPLSAVQVRLVSTVMTNEMASTRTDDAGRFALEAMPPRELFEREARLFVEKEGFAAQVKLLKYEAADGLDFTFNPTAPIHGVVVDPESKPLEGARVLISQGTPGRMPSKTWDWKAQTGPDGKFMCPFPPEGTLNLNVSSKDLQPYQLRGSLREGPITATLGPMAYVEGRVTSKKDGSPLPRFTVVAGNLSTQGHVLWQTGGMIPAPYIEGEYRMPMPMHSLEGTFKLKAEAEGYRPLESPVLAAGSTSIRWDAQLEPAGQYAGRVVNAEGEPLEGIKVYGSSAQSYARVLLFRDFELSQDFPGREDAPSTCTDSEGRFVLPHAANFGAIVVLGPSGSRILCDPAENLGDVTLEPWCTIRGRLYRGQAPDKGRALQTSSNVPAPGSTEVIFGFEAHADEEGRFEIRAHSGWSFFHAADWKDMRVREMSSRPAGYRPAWTSRFNLEPGAESIVELGKGGRTVTGRIVGVQFQEAPWWTYFNLYRDFPEQPEWTKAVDGSTNKEAYEKWLKTPEIQSHLATPSDYEIEIGADGRFTIENVVPGHFFVGGDLTSSAVSRESLGRPDREKHYEIPASESLDPFDLGDIPLIPPGEDEKSRVNLQVGQPAPDFSVTASDGKPIRLSDLKGKVVVLEFWATWCGPCLRQIPALLVAHKRFGTREDVVMVGLSQDKSLDALKRGAEEHKITWPQALVTDDAGKKILKAFGVDGIPHLIVIGRNGTIVGNRVMPDGLETVIEAALLEPVNPGKSP